MQAFHIDVTHKPLSEVVADCELVPIALSCSVAGANSPVLDRAIAANDTMLHKIERKLPIAFGAAWCFSSKQGPMLITPSRVEGEQQEKLGWSYALQAAFNACQVLGLQSIKISLEGLETDEVEDLAYALTFTARGYFGPVQRIIVCAPDDVVHAEFADRTLDVVNELWAA